MNVNDYQAPEGLPEDLLLDIFRHQHKLAEKYLDIEESNHLLQTRDIPVEINDKMGQARIKDEFWRATEEVCEALEALDEKDYVHFHEELADAMHFLVECMLLADVLPYAINAPGGEEPLSYYFSKARCNQPRHDACISNDAVHEYAMTFIKEMGLAANCLKNKPWKQTHMLTDTKKFYSRMSRVFDAFIALCKVSGFTAEGLYNMYMRKNEVNKFRQNSGY